MDITALVCADDRVSRTLPAQHFQHYSSNSHQLETSTQPPRQQQLSKPQSHQPLPSVSSLSVATSALSASSSLDSLSSPINSLTSLPPLFSPTPQYPPQQTAHYQAYSPIPSLQHPLYQLPLQAASHTTRPSATSRRPQASQQRVECALCGKSFSGISSHNRHVSRTHHKARPFACSQCDLQFGQKGSLDRHTAAVHLKERPYTCEHCHKGFGRKDNMKIHMTTVHLKKKPYKCDMCPKSFGGKRPLKIHRQTVHFKQRPLQCEHCDKRFGQRSNLNVHMKVHRRAANAVVSARALSHAPAIRSPPTSPIGSIDDLSSVRTESVTIAGKVEPFPTVYPESRGFASSPI